MKKRHSKKFSVISFFQSRNAKKGVLDQKTERKSIISELRSPYRKGLVLPDKIRKTKKTLPRFDRPKPSSAASKGKRILAIILAIGILCFAVYAILFSNYFAIENYTIEEDKNPVAEHGQITKILQKTLDKNLIFLNGDIIEKEILKNHPEIESVEIKKIYPQKLTVNFKKFPVAANIINVVNGIQKKFLVDSRGFLTEENNEKPYLPYIKIKTESFLKTRTFLLDNQKDSTETLNTVITAIKLFEEKFGMKIFNAVLLPKEREIHLYTEKFFYVMIDLQKNIGRQIEKLKIALPKLDIYQQPLVYIDLRISGANNEKVIFLPKSP